MSNKMPFPAVHGMENQFSYDTFPEMASAYLNVLLSIKIIITDKEEIKTGFFKAELQIQPKMQYTKNAAIQKKKI